jgi:DNA-binding NtrC family response regulator
MALCLVVEDEPRQRAVLLAALRAEGWEVAEADRAAAALDACRTLSPEVALLDLGLPDGDGLQLIPEVLQSSPMTRVVVLTGRDSVTTAVGALRAGARHYLVKPWQLDELLAVLEREARAVDLVESSWRQGGEGFYWGSNPAMRRLRERLERLAAAPMTPVLIEGETGTGKEVVARHLHALTPVAGQLVAMNCAAVPAELMESELFGHERGAFTGAESRRRGLAELARDGTLFLDEIGEMSPALQPKLLRFLQDARFRRVGGEEEIVSRCRFVAATHRDLEALQDAGGFRSDLYYRLAVVRLWIPPLRQRREDLLPLAYFLIEQIAAGLGRRPLQLAPDAEQAVVCHHWRGNVRELRNRLERALVLGAGDRIEAVDLDLPDLREAATDPGYSPVRAGADEAERLRRLLEEEDWNVSSAARRRGVPRHWLRYRMLKYGLQRPGTRSYQGMTDDRGRAGRRGHGMMR